MKNKQIVNNLNCVHIIFSWCYCYYHVYVGSYTRNKKSNVNILDGVHIIFLYLIVTVLRKITSNSCMVGITIEEEKNNVNNLDCVHNILFLLIVTIVYYFN